MSNNELERQKICYDQNCQHMRHLSQIMYQIPLIAMTLTGGLWYGVATLVNIEPLIKDSLLLLSAIANVCLIIIINRIRDVMAAYLIKIEIFHPSAFPRTDIPKRCFPLLRERGVCNTFCVLMGFAAVMSAIGIFVV